MSNNQCTSTDARFAARIRTSLKQHRFALAIGAGSTNWLSIKESLMKTIIAASVTALFIVGAQAQTPAAPAGAAPSSASMAKGDAKRDMRVEHQIKDLHAKLKITSSEETMWNAVADSMRDSAKDLDAAIDKRKSARETASAVDDLNEYGDIAQAHADGVKKLSAAFAPLYGAMPDEQKRLADEVFEHRAHEMKKISKVSK
jgi:periplasmic protein CpxP/Spy